MADPDVEAARPLRPLEVEAEGTAAAAAAAAQLSPWREPAAPASPLHLWAAAAAPGASEVEVETPGTPIASRSPGGSARQAQAAEDVRREDLKPGKERGPTGELYSASVRLRCTYFFALLAALALALGLALVLEALIMLELASAGPGTDSAAAPARPLRPGRAALLAVLAPAGLLLQAWVSEGIVELLLDAMHQSPLAATLSDVRPLLRLAGLHRVDAVLLVVAEAVPVVAGAVLCLAERSLTLHTFVSGYCCGALLLASASAAAHASLRAARAARFDGGGWLDSGPGSAHEEYKGSFQRLSSCECTAEAPGSPVSPPSVHLERVPLERADATGRMAGVAGLLVMMVAALLAEMRLLLGPFLALGLPALATALLGWSLGQCRAQSARRSKYSWLVLLNVTLLLLLGLPLCYDLRALARPEGGSRAAAGVGHAPARAHHRALKEQLSGQAAGRPETTGPEERYGYPICGSRWGVPGEALNQQHTALDMATFASSVYLPDIQSVQAALTSAFRGTGLAGANATRLDRGRWPGRWALIELPNSATSVIAVRGSDASNARMAADLYTATAVLHFFGKLGPILDLPPHRFAVQLAASLALPAPKTARQDLEDFARAYMLEHPEKQLLFTGHSFGGAIAAAVSAKLQRPALVFSAPAWDPAGRVRFGLGRRGVEETVAAVLPDKDLVEAQEMPMPAAMVQRIRCTAGAPADCHSLLRTTCELWRACGDVRGRDFRSGCADVLRAEDMPPCPVAGTGVGAPRGERPFQRWYKAESSPDAQAAPLTADPFSQWHGSGGARAKPREREEGDGEGWELGSGVEGEKAFDAFGKCLQVVRRWRAMNHSQDGALEGLGLELGLAGPTTTAEPPALGAADRELEPPALGAADGEFGRWQLAGPAPPQAQAAAPGGEFAQWHTEVAPPTVAPARATADGDLIGLADPDPAGAALGTAADAAAAEAAALQALGTALAPPAATTATPAGAKAAASTRAPSLQHRKGGEEPKQERKRPAAGKQNRTQSRNESRGGTPPGRGHDDRQGRGAGGGEGGQHKAGSTRAPPTLHHHQKAKNHTHNNTTANASANVSVRHRRHGGHNASGVRNASKVANASNTTTTEALNPNVLPVWWTDTTGGAEGGGGETGDTFGEWHTTQAPQAETTTAQPPAAPDPFAGAASGAAGGGWQAAVTTPDPFADAGSVTTPDPFASAASVTTPDPFADAVSAVPVPAPAPQAPVPAAAPADPFASWQPAAPQVAPAPAPAPPSGGIGAPAGGGFGEWQVATPPPSPPPQAAAPSGGFDALITYADFAQGNQVVGAKVQQAANAAGVSLANVDKSLMFTTDAHGKRYDSSHPLTGRPSKDLFPIVISYAPEQQAFG